MKLQKYRSLKQSFIYVENDAFPFINTRLYSNGNGRYDVVTVDGYGKVFEWKEDRSLDNAKNAFKTALKKYHD